MTTMLPKCDHCKHDKYPGQLQSDGRGGLQLRHLRQEGPRRAAGNEARSGEGNRLEWRQGLGVLNG